MPIFQYQALNSVGQEVNGEVEATNSTEAINKIRNLQYYPTSVKEKGGRRGRAGAAPGAAVRKKSLALGGVKSKHLSQFTRQLSTLVDAGLPIVRSVRILENQLRPGVLKNALMDVSDDIEGGATFSEALAKHPKVFDRLYVNMVKAGEAGGVLDVILQRLAEFKEKSERLKKRIIGAMIYPVVVVTIAAGILTGIMVFIIPRFQEMFEDFDVELPTMTLVLIRISHWVKNNYLFLLLTPVIFFVAVMLIRKNRGGRYVVDLVKMRVPLFGQIISKSSISRFSRTLGTLITSGVPILEALNIVRDTTGNEVVARAITRVHDSIREGETVAEPLRQSRVCDDMVVNMVDVGEETGDLDKMLIKVADAYDEDVDNMVASMVSLLEPMLIVFLGGAVGFIVISLFLPLVKLIQELGR
jgi:type IV pilus assembly protein PilC